MDFPLVRVEWEDSRRPRPEWVYVSDLDDWSVVLCVTVGWLLHDGNDVKGIAQNIGDVGSDAVQASGIVTIPSRAITRMDILTAEAKP